MAEDGADLAFAGVAVLARRLRDRELSPVDLARACLARIETLAPGLACFVTVTAERALAEARRAEAELAAGRWRGPLHGVPAGLADVVDTGGVATTCGARPWAERVPAEDATVAARLADAGALLAGKLSVIELAGGLGYGSAAAALNGPCRNPWDPQRWAGGAMAGPAAAVAAGLVPFALGTDTWGDVARPAALCGVTGYRPTYGVLSRRGTLAVAYSLDRLGALCRSAEDCATVVSVLAGADPRDPASIPPPPGLERLRAELAHGVRVGVLPFPEGPEVLPGAREAFEAAQETLRGAGAILSAAALPELPGDAAGRILLEAEAANALEELVRSGRTAELSDPSHRTRARADYAPRAGSADYVRAARIRGELQRALARLFERHDLLLGAHPPLAPPALDAPLPPAALANDPLGVAIALGGLPAATFPIGRSGRFPLSAQLAGPALDDARVLGAVRVYQLRTEHHLQRPPDPEAPAVAAVTVP
jgi:aspartyl-tRNA(Asn)/glutamyl-tRNA(Gln) amidotransferase subunit A